MKKALLVFGAVTAVVGFGVTVVRVASNRVFPQPSVDSWPEFQSDVFTEMPMDSAAKDAKPASSSGGHIKPFVPAKKAAPVTKVAAKRLTPVKKAVSKKAVPVKKVAAKKAVPAKKVAAKKVAAKRLVPVKKAVSKK